MDKHAPVSRGRVPSVERGGALCKVLELEFYIGPPRDGRPVDAERLERALETPERTLAATGRTMGYADRARAIVAVYELIGDGRRQAHTRKVVNLIKAVARGRPQPKDRGAAPER